MKIAGIMSGTSVDGIDVAVCEISGRRLKVVAGGSRPWQAAVRNRILAVSNRPCHTADIARLHFELAEHYAEAVRRVCDPATLDGVGCHGQTIFHEGRRATLQIGDGSVLAERLGVPVVSDFRPRDIAAGGEGAPLVPYFDYFLFRHARRNRVALNIGGIANVTLLPAGAAAGEVKAFDTGPGNMVIDQLVERHTGGRRHFDAGGRIAAQGHVEERVIARLLKDRYYGQAPPKSAGREQYGPEFVDRLVAGCASLPDAIATATAFTAVTIAQAVTRFGFAEGDLIAAGGGVHNPALMGYLAAYLPGLRVETTAEHGIDPDLKEAAAFALFAGETLRRRPSNLPSATGAKREAVLGKVSW